MLLIRNAVLDGRAVDLKIEHGRFSAVAPAGAHPEWRAARTVDASGKAVTPAFYNTHTHAAMTLMRGYADDLELMDWLSNHIWPLEAKLTEEDVYVGAKLAILEMIRSGTVFFDDMYWFQRGTLRAVREMGVRACLGLLFIEGPDGKVLERNLRSNAEVLEAIGDDPMVQIALAPHSIYTVSEPTLRMVREQSEKNGLRVHIHLAETVSEAEKCRQEHRCSPAVYLDKLGLVNENLIAAHCVALDDAELDLMSRKRAVLAHMPCSNLKLGSGIFRFHDAARAGCRVTIGTDGTSSNNSLSMLDEMKFAALLGKYRCNSVTGVTAPEVFHAATAAGAEAFGIAAGRIEAGMAADCILWDSDRPALLGFDLTSNLVYAADSAAVDTVVCAGRVLMENRHVPGEAEIVSAARETIARLQKLTRE